MRAAAGLLASAMLLAACAGASPSAVPRTPPPATEPIAPATTVPGETDGTEPASTDFSSSELCPGGTGNTCRLGAGEHHSLGFGDGIAFSTDGSWIVRANETDVISLETGLASNPLSLDLITGAIRFQDPATAELTPVTDPAEARERLAATVTGGDKRTQVTERDSTTVAGLPAVVFDVTNEYGLRLFTYPVTEHVSDLSGGRTARFIWTTWDGAPLIVSIEAGSGDFESFLAQVQPVIDSLELGDED